MSKRRKNLRGKKRRIWGQRGRTPNASLGKRCTVRALVNLENQRGARHPHSQSHHCFTHGTRENRKKKHGGTTRGSTRPKMDIFPFVEPKLVFFSNRELHTTTRGGAEDERWRGHETSLGKDKRTGRKLNAKSEPFPGRIRMERGQVLGERVQA